MDYCKHCGEVIILDGPMESYLHEKSRLYNCGRITGDGPWAEPEDKKDRLNKKDRLKRFVWQLSKQEHSL